MCVILIKTKKAQKFKKEEIFSHFMLNHDGAGICCINPKKVWVPKKWSKQNLNIDDIWADIDKYQNDPFVDTIIVHLRKCSVGSIGIEQAHPHTIFENGLYLIHNGTFFGYGNEIESDSQQMSSLISQKYKLANINEINDETLFYMSQLFVNKNPDNRVVLAGINNFIIFNSKVNCGYWYSDGIWRCGLLGDYQLPKQDENNKSNYYIEPTSIGDINEHKN